MMRGGWLAGLLAVSAVAGAQDWEAQVPPEEMARAEAHRAYTARMAEALALEGDARSLAFAAILRGFSNPGPDAMEPMDGMPSQRVSRDEEATDWLGAAALLAGQDILANQLIIAASKAGDESQRRQAARRWLVADPGNLTPLLFMGLSPDELLSRARDMRWADARMYAAVRWMASAYRRHPPTAHEQSALGGGEPFAIDEFAALHAVGVWTAMALPGYQPVVQACRDNALGVTPSRVADCRHLASLLTGSRANALDQSIGLRMLSGLPGSDVDRIEIEARQRRIHWQMLQWGRAAQQQPRDGAEQFVRLLADPSIDTEQQLLERVLQEAGIPLEPPPGWTAPGR